MDERTIHDILGGRRATVGARLLRGLLSLAEPAYAAVMSTRNWLYGRSILKAHQLHAAVISIGNITTGGTGKTPMVQWLARQLRRRGLTPAVLIRGYKGHAGWSDEQQLLRRMLGDVPVLAEPDRVAGANRLLKEHPQTQAILLDDGFQHRRLARDFDLVLVDATNPFGFGHVLPRGLLRERRSGLGRADAIVLTRNDLISPQRRRELESELHGWSPRAAIYRARHQLTGLRSPGADPAAPPDLPLDWLSRRRWIAAAGIGNPAALEQQLRDLPGTFCGGTWFGDHHGFTE
ncbi:MAG: tetraacyldisaccharide 4'-kinase, partial [Tepidisphaeraceae bacterium]